MKNLPLAGFRPLFAFLLLFASLSGCKKDSIEQPLSPSFSRDITLEEVIAKYGKHGAGERTDEKLPLDLIPNFERVHIFFCEIGGSRSSCF